MSPQTGQGGGIEVEGLRFGYPGGAFTLEVPALRVARGERVVCIGPSGSGKSTLLHLVAGILRPAAGSIRIDGVELAGLEDRERRRLRIARIGLVFQEFELIEHLSVRENVLLPFLVGAELTLDASVEDALWRCAEAAGIARLLGRRPGSLSHGERQRVAICRALVTRPALLLADEPTGNLDPTTTRGVLDFFLGQARERDATVLFVTHDHGLLADFDRVVDLGQLAGQPA